jgi:hypothetical protein
LALRLPLNEIVKNFAGASTDVLNDDELEIEPQKQVND